MSAASNGKGKKGRGVGRGLRLAALAGGTLAFGAIVAPSVGNAFSSGFDSQPVSLAARGGIGSFTPVGVDPKLAAQITVRALSHAKLFRFTPAGADGRPGRSVTVAVRIDDEDAHAFSVRSALAGVPTEPGAAPVRIAPMVYNLGVARGYESFAIDNSAPKTTPRAEMPDLANFSLSKSEVAGTPGRFAPRIEMDEKEKAGRAPHTFGGQGDYQVDVGGSYRLTRNLNVTAGLRYSSERDRLAPLTDGKQDSQAVYVGTQFRF